MIRKLLATTALATLVATGVYAQQQPATDQPAATDTQAPVVKADGFLVTNIIGESVYNGTGDNAENVGDVNDIVLDKEGKTQSVVVGVGGFLGVGERNVAVEWGKLSWAEANGDRWLVYPATKEQLEALPEFDRRPFDPVAAPVASDGTGASPATTEDTAAAPATDPAPADQTAAEQPAAPAPADQTAETTAEQPAAPAAPADQQAAESTDQPAATDTTTTGAIDKSTLTEVPAEQLTTEQDLVGTTVYGANDENMGEISDVVLSQDGKVDAVIVDVGGFLGMGEKPVAVGFDKLQFMADKDGKKYLYTPFTKDQLNAQTAYDESSYAQNRDQQRLMMQ